MRVIAAADALRRGDIEPVCLWPICTPAEQIQVALIMAWPEALPGGAQSIREAWRVLNKQQRTIVRRYSCEAIQNELPPV